MGKSQAQREPWSVKVKDSFTMLIEVFRERLFL